MNITLKEIAKLAGVSPSTVSRTISDHPSISAVTKEKVRKAMQELGYGFANPPLSMKDSKTIGVVLPASEIDTFENSFFLETLRGITMFCNKKQYSTILITGSSNDEIIEILTSMTRENKLDGVILLYSVEQDPIMDFLWKEGILFLMLGKDKHLASETIYIDNDNIAAAREATEYLINLGHRRIAYVGSHSYKIFSADRKSGYMLALTDHGITFDPQLCIELEVVPKNGHDELTRLLSTPDRPSALLVSDDIFAMVIEKTAHSLGLKIPEDLSIISFNNSLFAKLTTPQLTSIDINSAQLGLEAASQIINHIENPALLATKIIVPHFLVERDSCARHEG